MSEVCPGHFFWSVLITRDETKGEPQTTIERKAVFVYEKLGEPLESDIAT